MHVYLPEKVEKPNFRLTIGSCSRPVRRVSRERERQPREDQRRKIQEREMLGKVKHSVFPMFASSSHMDQTLVLGSQLYFSGVSLYIYSPSMRSRFLTHTWVPSLVLLFRHVWLRTTHQELVGSEDKVLLCKEVQQEARDKEGIAQRRHHEHTPHLACDFVPACFINVYPE